MAHLDQNPSHQHILQKFRQRETLMATPEVAALLRVSEDTIYRLADQGDIPTLKISKSRRFNSVMLAKLAAGLQRFEGHVLLPGSGPR